MELGDYLEQLFPFLGVRFISVNDGYDSDDLKDGETGGLDVAFKNIIYDYYSRELSKKSRLAWRQKARQEDGALENLRKILQAEALTQEIKQNCVDRV